MIMLFFLSLGVAQAQQSVLLRPASFQVKQVQLAPGLKLDYVEGGDASGVPVIFLHGFTDSWKSFDKVIANLPSNIHAYSITQRGHGNSDKPARGYAMDDFSNDVVLFMKKMKISSAIIVGHSMGSMVTQRLAIDHPELVDGILLVASFGSLRNHALVGGFVSEVEKLKEPLPREFAHGFQQSSIGKPIDSLYLKQFVDETMKVPVRVWKEVMKDFTKIDHLQGLRSFRKPALIVWGNLDQFCTSDDQAQLRESLPHAKFEVYEGIGHAIQWEAPSRFTEEVVQFVQRVQIQKQIAVYFTQMKRM